MCQKETSRMVLRSKCCNVDGIWCPLPKAAEPLESPCGSCLSETVDSKHLKHFSWWCTFQIQLQRVCESTNTPLSHPNHLSNCAVFLVGQVLWKCCLLECIWYVRSRSVLSRAVVMMSRAFAMEKRCVRPRSQLLLESRLLGQIHVAGHCHSEQKWCLVLCLFQSRFGPSAQTGPTVMMQEPTSSRDISHLERNAKVWAHWC